MAHQIESMMFHGTTPWHGLGKRLPEESLYDIDAGIRLSGLNWEVEKVKLAVHGEPDVLVAGSYAVRRSTDKKILGVVGERYTLLQNKTAFEWFQPFLDAKEARLHTAGSLAEGSRIWILVKLNRDPLVIKGDDVVEKFVLLSHSHDGSLAVRVGFTPQRVVCSNTLAMAHSHRASKLIRLRHSANLQENLDGVRSVMNMANQEFEATAQQYRALARRDINQKDLMKYIKLVLEVDESKPISSKMSNIIEKIVFRANHGRGNDVAGVRGTYWAAYNGLTEYLAYDQGRTQSSRLNSLWFGENANVNSKALELAVKMAS